MILRDCKFLADENIHPAVIQVLRSRSNDLVSIAEAGLAGADDAAILRRGRLENRVVLTHDKDFGTLAVLGGEPLFGIVYLRPGHVDPAFTMKTIEALFRRDISVEPPFLIVAQRDENTVRIRIRTTF